MGKANSQTAERLRVIADLLGISTDRFFETAPAVDPEDTCQLIYLWHRLRTPAGQAAALDAVAQSRDNESN